MDGVQGSNKGPFDGSLRRIQSDLYLLGGHGKRRQEQQNKYEDASREMAPARSNCSSYPQIVTLSIQLLSNAGCFGACGSCARAVSHLVYRRWVEHAFQACITAVSSGSRFSA